jgi:hypothetical protein
MSATTVTVSVGFFDYLCVRFEFVTRYFLSALRSWSNLFESGQFPPIGKMNPSTSQSTALCATSQVSSANKGQSSSHLMSDKLNQPFTNYPDPGMAFVDLAAALLR